MNHADKRKLTIGLMTAFFVFVPVVTHNFTSFGYASGPGGYLFYQNPCTNEAIMEIICVLITPAGIIPGVVCALVVLGAGYGTGCHG